MPVPGIILTAHLQQSYQLLSDIILFFKKWTQSHCNCKRAEYPSQYFISQTRTSSGIFSHQSGQPGGTLLYAIIFLYEKLNRNWLDFKQTDFPTSKIPGTNYIPGILGFKCLYKYWYWGETILWSDALTQFYKSVQSFI